MSFGDGYVERDNVQCFVEAKNPPSSLIGRFSWDVTPSCSVTLNTIFLGSSLFLNTTEKVSRFTLGCGIAALLE